MQNLFINEFNFGHYLMYGYRVSRGAQGYGGRDEDPLCHPLERHGLGNSVVLHGASL